MLHTELIRSFPSNSQEKVRIEIGVIEDLVIRKPTETFNLTLDINQYVTFVEKKIDMMNHVPTVKIIYPFGSPLIIEGDKTVMYEKNYIEIKFL
ncbi:hypothetical protein [Bacillus sp. CGMCC 1.16541]|jgi:hypothetical protein|uniref:hypothetical protein n=1 Tax=Bacillus sp. CGMCC 1.16541 TaxID=2185143 RepID=UPI000D73BEF4|nr:hypothetical protein [Bacillus sp. CGMCC 1.16541]